MAVDLSHIPDVALDTRSGQLIEAYLKTWRRVTNRPASIVEFLRHLHVRTVLGLDAPLDRKAMAILNLTILEHLRDHASRDPAARQQVESLAGSSELFLSIARGEAVTVDLDDHGTAGSIEIESGHIKVALSRPIELGGAAWIVQVGPRSGAVSASKAYEEIAIVSAIRIVDASQKLQSGEISWREFAGEWLVVWQRQMTRVLLEPLVPGSLRQFTAAAAMISLMMLQNVGKDLDDHTADDILPSAQCRKIWNDVLGEIADGGFVLARLASEDPITTLHFEGSERFGSDKGPALSVHPDLGMTLGRVSEARLVSEDVRASLRAAASRKGAVANDTPQPTQRAKIGRNALCPCGSGKKYKKCCWA